MNVGQEETRELFMYVNNSSCRKITPSKNSSSKAEPMNVENWKIKRFGSSKIQKIAAGGGIVNTTSSTLNQTGEKKLFIHKAVLVC